MSKIASILVANRGEIAVRVIKTAQSLGYRTVAVYSDADQDAPHVRLADQAARIGPPPVGQSYLDPERILQAAHACGADAVHPGYGFLSENAAFAAAVEQAGLTYIGPTPEAIAAMGDKAEAKRRMIEAGVACVPGYQGADQSDEHYIAAAEDIGFPVMVKASAGGGGRGMRLVEDAAQLVEALAAARSEAEHAFGSGDLILEKAILRPRHVEIQVFADSHGNVIHLGERDCSVQRRHQKVVEEAPCPVLTPELRERMGAAAVQAARSIAYRGAGTVEFLLDADGAFYFLEMNTRLQVEHPVTELVCGLDLVALQIKVAEGEPLGLTQEDVRLDGHAIEVRLYAEDPAQDFLPQTGPVDLWRPAQRDGVRVDAGIATGGEVSPYYDPMLAKIMAWGPTREAARRRLIDALRQTTLFGVTHNKGFLIEALGKETFAQGAATTAFLAEEFPAADLAAPELGVSEAAIAAVMAFRLQRDRHAATAIATPRGLLDWSTHAGASTPFRFAQASGKVAVSVFPLGGDRYRVMGDGEASEIAVTAWDGTQARIVIDGERRRVVAALAPNGELHLDLGERTFSLTNLIGRGAAEDADGGGGRVVAPMHGRVVAIEVAEGQAVDKGDRLLTLEAMKMQHAVVAAVDGSVVTVACKPDDQVAAEDLLMEIAPAEG